MKDIELRGLVLQEFYNQRKNGPIGIGVQGVGCLRVDDVGQEDVVRICVQLGQYGLIEWKNLPDHRGNYFAGVGRITALGVDIIEGEAQSPLSMHIDQSHHEQHIHIEGQNSGVQIAGANSQQQQSVQQDIEKLITAINGANVSEADKKEAKGILATLLQSKAVATIMGGAVGGLLKHCGL